MDGVPHTCHITVGTSKLNNRPMSNTVAFRKFPSGPTLCQALLGSSHEGWAKSGGAPGCHKIAEVVLVHLLVLARHSRVMAFSSTTAAAQPREHGCPRVVFHIDRMETEST